MNIIYDLLYNACRPLQRMVAGMMFGALAFCVAALLQMKIDV